MKFKEKLRKSIERQNKGSFYSRPLRLAFVFFLNILFCSIYHLYKLYYCSFVNNYANTVAYIWIIVFSVLLISLVCQLKLLKPRINEEEESISQKFSILQIDFRPESKIGTISWLFFILRRTAWVLILVMLWKHGIEQLQIIIGISLLLLLFKLKFREYENILMNIQDIVYEVTLIVMAVLFFNFTKKNSELSTKGRGYIFGII